jgi:flagella synthesis protein FlgN
VSLHKLLLDEVSCMEAFLVQLDQEKHAMAEGRFADLTAIAGEKTRLLARIAGLDQTREIAQTELGFGPGRAGAQAAAGGDGSMRPAWDLLLALAQQVRDSNYRNGAMVYTHLDFTQKALGFLQRVERPFYGPDGATRTASGAGMRLASG